MKKLIIFLVVMGVTLVAYVEMTNRSETKEPTTEAPKASEWCFLKTMPYGGSMSFGEKQAGTYQYQLFAAKDGVEVWVSCD